MKIAAVVILYHPPEAALTNIETYYQHVQKIYVYDNTEQQADVQDKLAALSNVELYHDRENKGIAARLNAACKKAIQDGFEWLLTMDQDTAFDELNIIQYFKCFSAYRQKEKVAVFGPEFNRPEKSKPANCNGKETEKLITSGALLNLALVNHIGGFDEALFIDAVDYDYCFRAKMKGYKIVQFPEVYMAHPIGHQVYAASIKTLFLIRKKKQIHSPLRCYYMYRNMLYLKKKYRNENPVFAKQIEGYVKSKIKTCILYGKGQTLAILKYLILAKKDYENNRMGKVKNEM